MHMRLKAQLLILNQWRTRKTMMSAMKSTYFDLAPSSNSAEEGELQIADILRSWTLLSFIFCVAFSPKGDLHDFPKCVDMARAFIEVISSFFLRSISTPTN